MMSWSFQSGALEERNIYNMQAGVPEEHWYNYMQITQVSRHFKYHLLDSEHSAIQIHE